MNFVPSKKLPTDFNKGQQYKSGDAVQAKTLNDLIESQLYVQELAFQDVVIFGDVAKEIEAYSNADGQDYAWKSLSGNRWEIYIPQPNHGFKTINSVVAEKINTDGSYENMIYGLKYYKSGSVSIILDEKTDTRIVIKGDN